MVSFAIVGPTTLPAVVIAEVHPVVCPTKSKRTGVSRRVRQRELQALSAFAGGRRRPRWAISPFGATPRARRTLGPSGHRSRTPSLGSNGRGPSQRPPSGEMSTNYRYHRRQRQGTAGLSLLRCGCAGAGAGAAGTCDRHWLAKGRFTSPVANGNRSVLASAAR